MNARHFPSRDGTPTGARGPRRLQVVRRGARARRAPICPCIRGEVLGLVGDNGAGKTTLVKCLSGVHRPDAGEIVIDGTVREGLSAEQTRSLGVETVYQNLSLVDTLDVMQNFFLNRELVYRNPIARTLGLMNKRRMYRETTERLQRA